MTRKVEFCFDVVSPAAYIAWHVLPRVARAARAEIAYTPMFLGGLMQAAGNAPPMTVPNKGAWMARDVPRWCAKYAIPYERNETFPQMTLPHMRLAVALQGTDLFRPVLDRLYAAMHAENLVIQDGQVLAGLLAPFGITPEDFKAKTGDPAVKDRLKANTEGVHARGGFGAPTFFVGGNMHFGQDRLWMVAEDLGTTIEAALAA